MKKLFLHLFLILFAIISQNVSYSATLKQLPLYGGKVSSLKIASTNPLKIYACTNRGLYLGQLLNNNFLWNLITPLSIEFLTEVEVSNNGVIYVGTMKGLYKSEDSGKTWKLIKNGWIQSIKIPPSNPGELWVSMRGWGLFKSTNYGNSFTEIYAAPKITISSIAFSPNNPHIILLGTLGKGVFKSTDGGKTFNPSNNGLILPYIQSIEFMKFNPSIVFLAANDNVGADSKVGVVFKSYDSGANWSYTNHQDFYITDLAIGDKSNGPIFITSYYNGVLMSENLGDSWKPRNLTLTNYRCYDVEYKDSLLFVGNSGGVELSSNEGENWHVINNGINALQINDIKSSSNFLILATEAGIFRSFDNGNSFSLSNNGIPKTAVKFLSVAIKPDNNNIIYAGSEGRGWFISNDKGNSWKGGSLYEWIIVNQIIFEPSNPSIVYAVCGNNKVFISYDAGNNWQTFFSPTDHLYDFLCMAIDTENPNIMWVGTSQFNIFRTLNRGKSWQTINPRTGIWLRITAFKLLEIPSSQEIICASDYGIFKSFDNGDNWVLTTPDNISDAFRDIVFLKNNPPTIIAITYSGKILISYDRGNNWRNVPLNYPNLQFLTIDVSNNQEIFIGTNKSGLFKLIL